MARVAVLGLGAMGSRMAMRLIAAGHQVAVWNRTAAATAPLEAAGAMAAPTPRQAVAEAEVVISMVRDDAAAYAVWLDADGGALSGLRADAVALECSTLSAAGIGILARAMSDAGVAFLDAPVAGSRPQAEAGRLIHFVGGEAGHLARVEPVLGAMAAAVHHVGPVGAGSAVKLAVNTLFGVQVAALAEVLALLTAAGVDPARAVEVIAATPVCSPAAQAAAGLILAGNHAPKFPVALVEKDFGYALASAEAAHLASPVTQATHALFGEAVRRGLGGDHLTVVACLPAGGR